MSDEQKNAVYECISSKGKVVNEQRKIESQAIAQIKKSKQYKEFNEPIIFADIFTDLPTDEDHNFGRYKECFYIFAGFSEKA